MLWDFFLYIYSLLKSGESISYHLKLLKSQSKFLLPRWLMNDGHLASLVIEHLAVSPQNICKPTLQRKLCKTFYTETIENNVTARFFCMQKRNFSFPFLQYWCLNCVFCNYGTLVVEYVSNFWGKYTTYNYIFEVNDNDYNCNMMTMIENMIVIVQIIRIVFVITMRNFPKHRR